MATCETSTQTEERTVLSKPDYFMGMALLSAKRSKDPSTQVGACIVNQEDRIVGIGYNGMPHACPDDEMPWGREGDFMNIKYTYVCHAVMNAIVNKNAFDVRGCTIYTVLIPCNECAKLITQTGISKVVYISEMYKTRQENKDQEEVEASKKILDVAGIKYLKFEQLSKRKEITVEPIQSPRPNVEESKDKMRTNYLQEADYFMAIAFLSAQRSKDRETQVGACIISEDSKVVGIGYNSMPNHCSDDIMPWNKYGKNSRDTKFPYVCHAELNAIMNKNCFDLKGCSIYVTLCPCNECAKLILQSGIKEVVFMKDKDKEAMQASKFMMDKARPKVVCRQFKPTEGEGHLVLDFYEVEKRINQSK